MPPPSPSPSPLGPRRGDPSDAHRRPARAQVARREPAAGAHVPARRFLVIDHSSVTQRIIVRALEADGHAAVAAGTCADASALLREAEGAFDHVLVDLRLSRPGALAAIREARALAGDTARITALTAAPRGSRAEARDLRECLRAGADGLLSKPLRPEDLEHLARGGGAADDA